ncbi:transaldolase [Micromonospora sediminicola]|uniref:Transaldolase n=1 Tax=Micromonospora sediminicola TaxID=946078 RepID=A0A1A9B9D5_9ACTN|nr:MULTISPECIES: transaldolase family protein [Micromonospora]SBT66130.1 transaldolase [Micromonospora sediminicola]
MTDNLRRLVDAGLSVWRDDPAAVAADPPAGTGLVLGADAVRAALAGPAATEGDDGDDAVRRITASVARRAADALLPAYHAAGGRDGLVSVEVDPRLADDVDGAVTEARRVVDLADRPNVVVRVFAAEAARELLAGGIGVEVALVSAPELMRAALDTVREGLDAAEGFPPALVSVPVADVDTEVDKRLWAIGTDDSARLRGTAALATARMTYAAYENALRAPAWGRLTASGAPKPRLVWTATQVRDPYYLETRYVDELVVSGAAAVLSPATWRAVVEYGEPRGDTVHGTYEEARQALDRLTDIGVDLPDVHRVIRARSVARSVAAWQRVRDAVAATRRQPVG